MPALRSPLAPPAPLPSAGALAAVLDRAAADAADVPGAYAEPPWAFRPATPSAERLLGAHGGTAPGGWIVVACRRGGDAAQQSHIRERCRTAAQRFTLTLAADGVDTSWREDGLPEALAAAAGLAPDEAVLGVIRWTPELG